MPSPEVKAKADELTNGLNSDSERVEALYNFVAKKIKYISLVSLGIGGYEPHSAEETINNGYGDCKDKIALLAALLEADGMQTSSVLISPSRQIDPDFPSPWPFTHVIAVLHLGKEKIWMDPSSAVLPFGMLTYSIRGEPGLVVPQDGAPHFEATPSDNPIPNLWSEEIEGEIDEHGTLDGTVKITARGDSELIVRQAFIGSVESLWPITVQEFVKGIDQREDKVSNVKISNPMDTDQPFTVSFRVAKPHFAEVTMRELRFPLPLAHFDLPPSGEEGFIDMAGGWHRGESEPVRFGPTGKLNYRLRLSLPVGWSPELPEVVLMKSKGVEYHATYTRNESYLTVARTFTITRGHISPVFRGQYADFRRRVLVDMDRRLSAKLADSDTNRN